MADITLLHWNIEQLGDKKYNNDNKLPLLYYIASIANGYNADIISIVEVKNAQSPWVINTLFSFLNGTWGAVKRNTRKNNEEYIIMYRTDRPFVPIAFLNGQVIDSAWPECALTDTDIYGNKIAFQSPKTPRGGRLPCYATFRTTDTNQRFSVLLYHGMYNSRQTFIGVENIARLSMVRQFNGVGGAPAQPIQGSIISGDFNLDYNEYNDIYGPLLAFSSNAVDTDTTMVNKPPLTVNQPDSYRANAYDNVFQRPPQARPIVNRGKVVDLIVESAIINNNPSLVPPDAVNSNGPLAQAAGHFDLQIINQKLNYVRDTPINQLPPIDVLSSWAFVREVISNHFPVISWTTI